MGRVTRCYAATMSNPIHLLRGALVAFVASVSLSACSPAQHQPADSAGPPNIVIVFVDDLGYGDLSCYGETRWQTPHLDAMAADGVRFTSFYTAQPVCSASRAALLTGCYPNRIGIHNALMPDGKVGLADDETTLAELCRSRGYATAIFGKWHLGHLPPFLPLQHGFDTWHGIPYSNDMGPDNPNNKRWKELPTFHDGEVVEINSDQAPVTNDLTRRAVAFIEDAVADERPFFVYVPHPMPHIPLFVSEQGRGASGAGLYGDVAVELDRSVGAILEVLERTGVDDNTLVLFTSDNGPWLNYGDHAGTTAGFREGKGTTFEGGVRVPAIARWPGRIPPATVCDEPVMTIDVLPTVARLIDAELPALPIDGQDVWPLFTGEPGATSPHESYAFYYHRSQLQAVRAGRWKLHVPHKYRTTIGQVLGVDGNGGAYDYSAKIGLELFDLLADPGETTDVAGAHPEVMERMLEYVEAWRSELGDSAVEREGSGVREVGRVTAPEPEGG